MHEILKTRPDVYSDELQLFLWDEFDTWVSERTVCRWLRNYQYKKQRLRVIALQRNQFLRDDWMRRLSRFRHLPADLH